jgi:hypothetical protein
LSEKASASARELPPIPGHLPGACGGAPLQQTHWTATDPSSSHAKLKCTGIASRGRCSAASQALCSRDRKNQAKAMRWFARNSFKS